MNKVRDATKWPARPFLFNIFTGSLIRKLSVSPPRAQVSLFLDDVLAFSRSEIGMQQLLNSCVECKTGVGINWTISKCSCFSLPTTVHMNGSNMWSKNRTTSLGVSMGNRGIKEDCLLDHMHSSRTMRTKIRRPIGKWNTTIRQRGIFIKTFVYILIDYLLYMQLLTPTFTKKRRTSKCHFCPSFPTFPWPQDRLNGTHYWPVCWR